MAHTQASARPVALPEARAHRDALLNAATRLGLAAVCLLAVFLGGRGFSDEGALSLQGDVPKYLMNGVYMMDAAHDRPFASVQTLLDYTRHYYARYPALSLGHHPPLVSALEVPAFAIFGVSVWSARLVEIASLLAAVIGLYLIVRRLYGAVAALLSAWLLATSPMIIQLTQTVLSEMPTVALVVWAAYFLGIFCATERRLALAGFAVCATLSLYGKQLAIFVFPAYAVAALHALGIRRLLKRDVVVTVILVVVAALPLVPMTLMLSQANVKLAITEPGHAHRSVLWSLWIAVSQDLSIPVTLLAATGLIAASVRRDGKALLFVAWVVSVAASAAVDLDPPRHAIYWVPALCALAGGATAFWQSRAARGVAIAAVVAAAAGQTALASTFVPAGAGGYEQAAQFVLASNPGPTVVFSGDVDTGYFTFFIRKHDTDRRLVVLRSDKILTTSLMGRMSVADRVSDVSEIYDVLHRFGTRYVVIEDIPSRSKVLEWLRQQTHTARFAERWRQPITTIDPRLRGKSLAVYELLDARAPDPDAVLSMDLPLIGQSVAVKLPDLIARKYLR